MKNSIVIICVLLSFMGWTQEKKQEVVIQTSAECGMCKEKIENALNYTKGISFAELDIETKQLRVKFKTAKISIERIRELIANLGYDADEVKADPESVKNLPMCCRPGGMDK